MSIEKNVPSNEAIWRSLARGSLCCFLEFSAKIKGFELLKNIVEDSDLPIDSSEQERLSKHLSVEEDFVLEEPFLANALQNSMDDLVGFISVDDVERRFDMVMAVKRLTLEMSADLMVSSPPTANQFVAEVEKRWAECIRGTVVLESFLPKP